MNYNTMPIAIVTTALIFGSTLRGADAVLDWNLIMETTVAPQPPFPQARFAAITQLAVFEAVNGITREYKPYLSSGSATAGASPEAAAVAAAHTVLKTYFPASAATLDAARARSLAAIADGPAKSAGIAAGEAAAAAVIASRANDNAGTAEFYLPSSSRAGQWQVTPACSAAGGAFLHWRKVTPFGLLSADQFGMDAPPALTSVKYARDYNELKQVGSLNSPDRPQDRTDVARFYAATAPVAAWNSVARQLSTAEGHSLSMNARSLALLNMSVSDAAVATFHTKYRDNFWRPETAIRMGDTDGNTRTDPDASFAPLISTPCFPGYPSAHAVLSNAAREVLERIYTSRLPSFTLSNPAVPGVNLKYSSLKQMTDDINDARVYGGIHFRFDQEAGADLGRRVGKFIYKNYLGVTGCGCEQD
jgi:hypothetical protein